MEYISNGKKYCEVILTPADAKRIWDKHSSLLDFRNRGIDKNNVYRFGAIINKGCWIPGMGTVEISPRGAIVDGQHRILAIMRSGCPVRVTITFEADERILPFLDTGGKRRTPAESMHMMGGPKQNHITSSCRMLIFFLRTGEFLNGGDLVRRSFISPEDIYAVYKKYEQFITAGINLYSKQIIKILPPSVGVSCFVLLSSVNSDAAYEFFKKVCEGTSLERGDPEYALRITLESNLHMHQGMRTSIASKAIILAWNDKMAGKKRFGFKTQVMKESPEITGFNKEEFSKGIEQVLQ